MQRFLLIISLMGLLAGCGIDDQSTFPSVSFLDTTAPTAPIQHIEDQAARSNPIQPPPPQVGDKMFMHPLWDPEILQPLTGPIPMAYVKMNLVQDVQNNPVFKATKQLSIIGAFNIQAWLPASSDYRSILVTELQRNDGSINFAALVEDQAKTITTINSMNYQFPNLQAQTLIVEIDGALFIVGRVDNQVANTTLVAFDRFVDRPYPSEQRVKVGHVHDGFFIIPIGTDERAAWQYLTNIRLIASAQPDTPLQVVKFHGPFAYAAGITSFDK